MVILFRKSLFWNRKYDVRFFEDTSAAVVSSS